MIHRFGELRNRSSIIAANQRQQDFRSDMEREHPLIQLHDPDSNDIALANRVAQEIINISGAEVVVYPRTENSDHDNVWDEDADPTYGAGRHMKAFFKPEPLAAELTQWGIDAPNQVDLIFCKEEVYSIFGKRMIRIGDVIDVPYNSLALNPDRFRVLNAFDSGNFKYCWVYYTTKVENLPSDSVLDIDCK